MGKSAVQAAENLQAVHGVAYRQIELTAMIRINDVAANEFHLNDSEVIARYACERGLAGVHFWALDRNTPCAGLAAGASANFSGMPAVPALALAAL